jgi:hypothetical protein
VAERKNRHMLEVARSVVYTMINRTPSRLLGMKSTCELVFGENKFVVPPKLFGTMGVFGSPVTLSHLIQAEFS